VTPKGTWTQHPDAKPMTPQPTARWWEYVGEGRIHCGPIPGGHHIPKTVHIPEHGFIRCLHWRKDERRECGLWVFVYVVRGGRMVVARVDPSEMETMNTLVTPASVIDYLGIFDRKAG
jgi:hypothetical protein